MTELIGSLANVVGDGDRGEIQPYWIRDGLARFFSDVPVRGIYHGGERPRYALHFLAKYSSLSISDLNLQGATKDDLIDFTKDLGLSMADASIEAMNERGFNFRNTAITDLIDAQLSFKKMIGDSDVRMTLRDISKLGIRVGGVNIRRLWGAVSMTGLHVTKLVSMGIDVSGASVQDLNAMKVEWQDLTRLELGRLGLRY